MLQRTISFFAALLFFMPGVIAQKTKVNFLQWKIAGALPAASGEAKALGVAGPITGVHKDVLMVAGGANFPGAMPWNGGKKKYYNDVHVFKRKGDSLVLHKTVSLPFAIAYSAVCSTSQGVLSVGGENEDGITSKVFLMQWNSDEDNIVVKDLPSLLVAVSNASAVMHHNKIYVAGGEKETGVSSDFFLLDLAAISLGWKKLSPLPKPVSHAVMVVQSNGHEDCIYLLGGRKRNPGGISDLYSSVLRYSFTTGKWSAAKPLPLALSAGTGVATSKDGILLFGGDTGETFHKTESLIAAINTEKNEEKKKDLVEEKASLQSTHPGFCRQVFIYNTRTDQWQKLGLIPFDMPVTTTAVKWNDEVFIAGGEIKAGVRTPHILSAKISQ